MPSSILEKGIIYFFIRNRVGVNDAESISDLQRTYFVLRPLPKGAKLGDRAIEDLQNNRLLVLPKKTFPKSHRDHFIAFVEKANTTVQDLQESVFQGSDYTAQTTDTRYNQPVMPVSEGVTRGFIKREKGGLRTSILYLIVKLTRRVILYYSSN